VKARRIRKRGKMVVEEFGAQKGIISGEEKVTIREQKAVTPDEALTINMILRVSRRPKKGSTKRARRRRPRQSRARFAPWASK
jgi:hypothetical protein